MKKKSSMVHNLNKSGDPRILMIAPACYPPNNPEAFVNANLSAAILAAGWDLAILTESDMAHMGWYPNDLKAWGNLAHSVSTYNERERTLFSRFAALLQSVARSGHLVHGGRRALPAAEKAVSIINEKVFDVVISRATPFQAHLSALIVAKKTGIPWIANWNDPMPFEKFPKPYPGKGKNAALGFWKKRFYSEVARQADWHTFPCERLRRYITDYLPKGTYEKSSVIPHLALDKGAKSFSSRREFTLMHAGSLIPPRSPDVFLKGVRLFRERNASLRSFSVVFIVDRPDAVRNAARSHGVEDVVRIEKTRPYTEMPALLAEADVLVIVEALVEEGIFLPSKFVDYVRTGRPILAISPAVGTLADVLNERGGGIAVDGRRAEAVADALQRMYECWLNGTLDEKYGSEKLLSSYSRETVLGEYREIIARISKKRKDLP